MTCDVEEVRLPQHYMEVSFIPAESLLYTRKKRLGWPCSRSGNGSAEVTSLLCRDSKPSRPVGRRLCANSELNPVPMVTPQILFLHNWKLVTRGKLTSFFYIHKKKEVSLPHPVSNYSTNHTSNPVMKDLDSKLIVLSSGLVGKFADLYNTSLIVSDRLCGLVVRVLGYRSGGPGSIPSTTRRKKK
jgi:hypothetical protein